MLLGSCLAGIRSGVPAAGIIVFLRKPLEIWSHVQQFLLLLRICRKAFVAALQYQLLFVLVVLPGTTRKSLKLSSLLLRSTYRVILRSAREVGLHGIPKRSASLLVRSPYGTSTSLVFRTWLWKPILVHLFQQDVN